MWLVFMGEWIRNLSTLLTATPTAVMKGGTVVRHVPLKLLYLAFSLSNKKSMAKGKLTAVLDMDLTVFWLKTLH